MNNPLYPAFFRLDRLQLLVVGAGAVGEEKLRFILKSSPNARVAVVAPEMGDDLRALLDNHERTAAAAAEPASPQGVFPDESPEQRWRTAAGGWVQWYRRPFRPTDVAAADLIVAATDIRTVNHAVHAAAKVARRLCNIADTPDLCDFYLGSIVTRGPLKVAISTNGQSPTFAKRFRQWLEAELPELETTDLLDGLRNFRDRLRGDFGAKVRQLNTLTAGLLARAEATDGSACACPPGECLLNSAAAPRPGASPTAPASAPQKTTDHHE